MDCLLNKGNAGEIIWNTKKCDYICSTSRANPECFFYPFLNVYDMFVSVNLYACEIFFSPVCVSVL